MQKSLPTLGGIVNKSKATKTFAHANVSLFSKRREFNSTKQKNDNSDDPWGNGCFVPALYIAFFIFIGYMLL